MQTDSAFESLCCNSHWRQNIKVQGLAPSPRASHSATVLDLHRFVVVGGGKCSPEGNWEHYGDAFVFDARTVGWRPLIINSAAVTDPRVRRFAGALPPRRGHVAGLLPLMQAKAENRSQCIGLLVVFGGTQGGVDGGTLNDVHVLRIAPAPPVPATGSTSATDGDLASSSEACDCMRACSRQWLRPRVRGAPPSPRRGAMSVVIGDSMLVYGGYTNDSVATAFDMNLYRLRRRRNFSAHADVSASTNCTTARTVCMGDECHCCLWEWNVVSTVGDAPATALGSCTLLQGDYDALRIVFWGGCTENGPNDRMCCLIGTVVGDGTAMSDAAAASEVAFTLGQGRGEQRILWRWSTVLVQGSIHRAPQARYCHSTAPIPFPSTCAYKRELVIMWGGTLSDDDSVADVCAVCGSPASSRCARCKETRYCSRACQREDWPCHKHICGQQQAQLHHLCDEARDMFCAQLTEVLSEHKRLQCAYCGKGPSGSGFSRRLSSCTLEEQAELLIRNGGGFCSGCAQTNLSNAYCSRHCQYYHWLFQHRHLCPAGPSHAIEDLPGLQREIGQYPSWVTARHATGTAYQCVTWSRLLECGAAPSARNGFSMVTLGSQGSVCVVFGGGVYGEQYFNDTSAYQFFVPPTIQRWGATSHMSLSILCESALASVIDEQNVCDILLGLRQAAGSCSTAYAMSQLRALCMFWLRYRLTQVQTAGSSGYARLMLEAKQDATLRLELERNEHALYSL